jgi:Bacterial PH domain
MKATIDRCSQAISGLVPPQLGEALIRQTFPSVAASPGIARLGQALTRTIVFAPLGWLIMAVPYFTKVLPGLARRYTLTNRRLMIQRGIKPSPVDEIALTDIDDVRIEEGSYNAFFRAATLEVLVKGKVTLRLPGVPEPEAFRQSILDACMAWIPSKATKVPFIPASSAKH